MEQNIKKVETVLHSTHGQMPMLADATYDANNSGVKPIVLFVHGFKGFKDWGPFNMMANLFAKAGFVFVKFNLSHNGTTLQQPTEFANLEAFGRNTFSIELDDIGTVIDHLLSRDSFVQNLNADPSALGLLGHSRGGGLALLTGYHDLRPCAIATWAAVSSFNYRWNEGDIEKWRNDGVAYILNSRTNQKMPLNFSLYQDTIKNPNRLNIIKAIGLTNKPTLVIHGTNDSSVPPYMARQLVEAQPNAQSLFIDGGDHTFGSQHPWQEAFLPPLLEKAANRTIEFFKQKL